MTIHKINTINSHCTKYYDEETNSCTIFSYDTPVLRVDSSGYHRLWGGWSATTQKDINASGFPFISGYKMTKEIWDKMEVER